MDKIIYLNIIIFLLSAQPIFAQKDTLQPYMISYDDKIIASLSFENNSDSFILKEEINGEIHNFNFFPNIKQKLTFGLTYKLIDISFGYTPWFMKATNSEYKASNFNFSTRFNHKQWYQSVTIVKQKGFFTEFLNNNSLYLPSFRSIKIGGTTSYVFNKNFSFSALFNQNQWQLKSAGSFVPNFSFFYTNLENKEDKTAFNLEMYSFSFSPAYYYTWVINQRVFLSGGLGLGAGFDIHRHKTSILGQVIYNSKLGYNTSSFYSYLEVNNTNFIFNDNSIRIKDASLNGLVAVGFRLDTPKKVKKVYNSLLNRIPKDLNL